MTVTRTKGSTNVNQLVKITKDFDGYEAKVGWFESAHYPEGTPVAYVATIHEFGAGPIPARPFMRPAVADHGGEWIQQLADGAAVALNGGMSPRDVLELVAMGAAGNVAEKIAAVTAPPLSQITLIARHTGKFKGGRDVGAAASMLAEGPQNLRGTSTKPLVDTGQMIQSVTGKVEKTG